MLNALMIKISVGLFRAVDAEKLRDRAGSSVNKFETLNSRIILL